MTYEISNSEDILDSRTIIARIEDLESNRQALVDAVTEADEALVKLEAETSEPMFSANGSTPDEVRDAVAASHLALEELDATEEADELKALQALASEAEGYGDWADGETLIRDGYFQTYAKELVLDIGDMPREIPSYSTPTRVLFVTSEQFRGAARRYSVRAFNRADATIDTVGEYQAYETLREAYWMARAISNGWYRRNEDTLPLSY